MQETSAGAEKKKPSGSGKAATEGEPTRNRRVTGLILLFDGEADCVRQSRRAQSNRYPDFGPDLAPAFPTLMRQWPWEFVARYSGATVPESHGVPRHLISTIQLSKSGRVLRRFRSDSKKNLKPFGCFASVPVGRTHRALAVCLFVSRLERETRRVIRMNRDGRANIHGFLVPYG